MKVNFAIIGTSNITETFLEAAGSVKDFNLKAVYSRSKEKAEEYAKKHGAELSFDSLDELASHKEVDAVYIASPNSLHASQSIQMMRSGKHVLCEKTIASNLREFDEMQKTAFENRVVLLEAMRSVFSPGFEVIRNNLSRLGTIRRASFQYCQYSSRYDKFKNGIVENVFNPAFSAGALMDLGVYCVHPLVALFGMPCKVTGSCLKLSNGVDGAGTVLVEYDGMQGELIYSKITASNIPSQIQGEDGTMVIQEIHNPLQVTIYGRGGQAEALDITGKENNLSYELEEFIRLVKDGRYGHEYLRNSRMEMELMDEARRQQGIVFGADEI